MTATADATTAQPRVRDSAFSRVTNLFAGLIDMLEELERRAQTGDYVVAHAINVPGGSITYTRAGDAGGAITVRVEIQRDLYSLQKALERDPIPPFEFSCGKVEFDPPDLWALRILLTNPVEAWARAAHTAA